MKNKDKKAIDILSHIGGNDHAVAEYKEIKKSLIHNTGTNIIAQAKEFFSRKMRLIIIIGFGLAIFQQFSGINAVLYYAPMIFESAGGGRDTAFMQAVVLGVVFMVMTIGSMFFIDSVGRRPLLFVGVSMMAISLLITGFAFRNALAGINSTLVLISILGFIAGFSISLGPVMWAIFSEIFPNHLRGFAISAVGVANSMSSFIVATLFPIQLSKFGSSNTYFIYAGFMFFCLWFIWKYVIETKGKSLEEIEKELITQNELY
jgi:SP family arabinose:H+ symporter-like MFS transporter